MKIKFKRQSYQTNAVEAVADCFLGQLQSTGIQYRIDPGVQKSVPQQSFKDFDEIAGFRNRDLTLNPAQILQNIQVVQRRQSLTESSSLVESNVCKVNLDIEMETGTGKTYCYIKSMFELHKRFGWSKFIVVVPSIAIREGVKKSFELSPRGGSAVDPFQRILKQILKRYLYSDSNFHTLNDNESRIPKFLLNDIVRYWRTICVDFAYKDWERAGKEWAIRNVKLRLSRKILFLSGLFMVFSCYKNASLRRNEPTTDGYLLKMQSHLLCFAESTPLNIVAWTLNEIGLEMELLQLLDHYERFLGIINDMTNREHLEGLNEKDVYEDQLFLDCRQLSHELQTVLRKVCFESNTPLREFMFEYGVF